MYRRDFQFQYRISVHLRSQGKTSKLKMKRSKYIFYSSVKDFTKLKNENSPQPPHVVNMPIKMDKSIFPPNNMVQICANFNVPIDANALAISFNRIFISSLKNIIPMTKAD